MINSIAYKLSAVDVVVIIAYYVVYYTHPVAINC